MENEATSLQVNSAKTTFDHKTQNGSTVIDRRGNENEKKPTNE